MSSSTIRWHCVCVSGLSLCITFLCQFQNDVVQGLPFVLEQLQQPDIPEAEPFYPKLIVKRQGGWYNNNNHNNNNNNNNNRGGGGNMRNHNGGGGGYNPNSAAENFGSSISASISLDGSGNNWFPVPLNPYEYVLWSKYNTNRFMMGDHNNGWQGKKRANKPTKPDAKPQKNEGGESLKESRQLSSADNGEQVNDMRNDDSTGVDLTFATSENAFADQGSANSQG